MWPDSSSRSCSSLVHVRDAVLADPDAEVRGLEYETLALDRHDTVLTAVGRMRAERAQLALVANPEGAAIGITALEDPVERVLGQFDDETDRPPA